MKTERKTATRRRVRAPKPKRSKEYLQGFHDCLMGITSLVVHLPVFMQCAGAITTPKGIKKPVKP